MRRTEADMLRDARDGRLDRYSLLDAALLAGGADDAVRRQHYQDRIEQALEQIEETLAAHDDPLTRAGTLYRWMHKQFLTGQYQAACTHLSETLENGNYNCVSATVLFHVLCHHFDLAPVAIATPTHVYSRLPLSGTDFDIQTTCPQWFDLDDAQRRAIAPVATAAPRALSDVELIAKIYYNRGVRCLETEQFHDAEQAFRISLTLDAHDQAARDNLLATLNNWALARCDAGDFEGAAATLNRGVRIEPDYPAFMANDLHIHQRWAQYLCREGRYSEAIALLEEGAARQPQAVLYRDGPVAIYRMWAQAVARQGDTAAATAILDQALRAFPNRPELVAERSRLRPTASQDRTGVRFRSSVMAAERISGE